MSLRTWHVTFLFLLVANCLAVSAFADEKTDAKTILSETGVSGGFIVRIGIRSPEELVALRDNEGIQVQGLDRDPKVVAECRKKLAKSSEYGSVAADHLSGQMLPYVDNLVNLLIIEDARDLPKSEIMRVLVPNGVAYQKMDDGTWVKTIKPRPKNIDDWSHYLHDPSGNSVAHDEVVGPPRHLQWVGSPRYSRHHDRMASMSALVSTGGRMFYIMDEGSRISIQLPAKWKLIARDAFNGTVLWKREIPVWQNHLWPLKSGPSQLSRRLVSDDKRVFVTLGHDAPCEALDAATGKTLMTYEGTDATEEIIHSGDLLFLVVRKDVAELADYAPMHGRVGDQKLAAEMFWNEEPRVLMAVDANTGKTLWAKQTKIAPLTLAADKEQAYYHDGEKIIAVNQRTGDLVWQSETANRRNQFTFNFGPRLVVHEKVVLFAGGNGKMRSVDKVNGKSLWESQHPNSGYQSPQDLMVQDGLVWCAPTTSGKDSGVFTGRDPVSGEVKKEFAPNVDTYWFHHRCYIAKATDRFLIPSRTGIEFVSTEKQDWDIHHWVRGGCLYGIMPCNGLTYAPPHNCACYPEAKLFGFNALAPLAPTRPIPVEVSDEGRLETGPSYQTALNSDETSRDEDWPTFRHDAARSGSATTKVGSNLDRKWNVELGGRLSAPVIANGHVYVARIDAHTLHALREVDGSEAWTFTAGGRIDSPPTVYRGRVIFGSTDGWVYCIRESDGALAWRYRAAPLDRRTMAYEQLESLWPVHGSVLVHDGIVHAVAGRSMFLDGGLRYLRLRVEDGTKVSEHLMDDKNPSTGNNLQEKVMTLQMPVGLADILSFDGKNIFMKSQKFDLEGKRLEIGPNAGDFVGQASVQRGEGQHLFAPMGFLDDSWFHRSYWVLGRSFAGGHGGYFQAGKYAPSGRLLVTGNGYVYGYGRKPEYLRWTTTMEHQLFKAEPTPPELPPNIANKQGGNPGPADNAETYVQFPKAPSLDPSQKPIAIEAWFTTTRPDGVIVARGGPKEGFALSVVEGHLEFAVRSNGTLNTVRSSARFIGGWHHIVGTLNKKREMALYVDGELAGTTTASGLLTADPAQGLEIGADLQGAVGSYDSPNGFGGIIDEVRLYFDDIDAQKIRERFDSGSELGQNPRLVLTFDDGTARDFSTFRNNGTLTGGTEVEGKIGKAIRFTAKNAAQSKGKANANLNNNKTAQQQNNPGNGVPDSYVTPKWTSDVPVYVRAMTLAGNKLFIAGPRDLIDEEETFKRLSERDSEVQNLLSVQDDALEGKISGLLLCVDCETSKVECEIDLGTLPAWDGMAGANGRLFLSTLDGRICCYADKEN